MKCSCCFDKSLTDYESTLKHAETGEYLDTCMKCLEGLGIPTKGRYDLSKTIDVHEEEDNDAEIVFYKDIGQLIDEDDC